MRPFLFVSLVLLGFGFQPLHSATSATATATFTIATINAISVTGNPAAFNINAAVAGSPPTNVTDISTTYAVTTNATSQRIQGSIDTGMPTGVTLSINLTAPTGGTSAGAVSMTTTAQNLVTGISNVAQSGLQICYTVSATPSASPAAATTRTVTYTIGP